LYTAFKVGITLNWWQTFSKTFLYFICETIQSHFALCKRWNQMPPGDWRCHN
jgi:hypothetical protein